MGRQKIDSNIKSVCFRAINDRPYTRKILSANHSRMVAKISCLRGGRFVNCPLPTNGTFQLHISMASYGYDPSFQRKTTIVEKSGLVAPDFFRQYRSVYRRNFQKTDVRTRQNSAYKLSLPRTFRGKTVFVLPSEGSVNKSSGKFLGVIGDFFQKVP